MTCCAPRTKEKERGQRRGSLPRCPWPSLVADELGPTIVPARLEADAKLRLCLFGMKALGHDDESQTVAARMASDHDQGQGARPPQCEAQTRCS